ncbi:acyltransferase family protein [Ktedonobacter racemifer]|uniref:Acyltransferase 3 n=1 Tax=Ktedonobacter racemifer DSM 44963 TaxID=485913 RepID=D6TRW5_KTERA|nr:acyltransferase [Ktedonobacter racemifer]EFH86038.1 acyltransferase 3 [Ktedonobacter racemifer DSM 44963]
MEQTLTPARQEQGEATNQAGVAQQRTARKPHVYELDPLRAITALVVVAVHVVSFTAFLNTSTMGVQLQNAVLSSLHFTRALFMFVTAFAMTYVYYDRFAQGQSFSLIQFWKKRGIGVLLPYCLWSIVYVWVNKHPQSLLQLLQESPGAILTGSASFQLYYILLTIQFYLLLPLFLWFLKQVRAYPWQVLGVSFLLQVLVFALDFGYIQIGTLNQVDPWHTLWLYQERIALMYQFYFVLGGITALHFQSIRAFLLRHGRWIVCGMLLALGMLWLIFYAQIQLLHEEMGLAVSVLQPIMVPYSGAIIVGAFWLACRWANPARRRPGERPRWYALWHMLSDASFGVYLIHALILAATMNWFVPHMPAFWPVALRVFLAWAFTAGSSALISIAFTQTPVFSRLVGRSQPLPSWLANVPRRAWERLSIAKNR